MDQPTCPRCGMKKSVWKGNGGEGVEKDGVLYCCEGCASNTGCTCGMRRGEGSMSTD